MGGEGHEGGEVAGAEVEVDAEGLPLGQHGLPAETGPVEQDAGPRHLLVPRQALLLL